MKIDRLIKVSWVLCLLSSSFVMGCTTRERVVTQEISEQTPTCVSNTVIQEHRVPGGRKIIEAEVVTETLKCVRKDGTVIPVKSAAECIKKQGKIVDEVIIEQEKIKRR